MVRVEWTIKIDADNLVPEVLIGLQEWHGAIPAGVVDQNPNRSDICLDLRDRTIHRRSIADVNSIGRNRGFRCKLRRLLPGVWPDVEDRNLATFLREPKGDGTSDALAST